MKKVSVLCAVVLMLISILVSCSKNADSGAGKDEKLTIGAILLDTKGEWMAEVMAGMKKAGTDLGIDVNVSDSQSDLKKEAELIDNYIAMQVDAITVSPQSDEASVAAFERAVAAKIPVVTWNSKVNSPDSKFFVGVNNYDLGKETGVKAVEYINDQMGGKAKIAVIGTTKYSVGMERVQGFLDQVEKLQGVEIVARQDAEHVELGMSVTENILEANPEVELIWCWNLTSMLGAYAAVKERPQLNIVMMGTDMSLDVAKYMMEDNSFLKIVTTQQPFEIGYQAIKSSLELANSGNTDQEVLVPLKTYTADDKQALKEYISTRDYLQ